MSIRFHLFPSAVRALLVASATFSTAGALTACTSATEETEQEVAGTMRLQLQASAGDTVYRLWPAVFSISNVDDTTLEIPDLTGGIAELALERDLAVGNYEVTINSDWRLRKQTVQNGVAKWETISVADAILTSASTQAFSITEQGVVNVEFTFLVGEDIIHFGEGRLGVTVGVDECDDSSSTACDEGCTSDADCGDRMVCDTALAECVAEYGKLVSVAPGAINTCGLDPSGQVHCWGYGLNGGLGALPERDSVNPIPADMPAGVTFTSLATGAFHSCALDTDGNAYCWGYNNQGQCGTNDTSSDTYKDEEVPVAIVPPTTTGFAGFASIGLGKYHSCALDSAGQAYCWGINDDRRLGHEEDGMVSHPVDMPPGVAFSALGLGHGYSCALDVRGVAFCWGSGSHGQLGNGDTDPREVPTAVLMPEGVTFAAIDSGRYHTCVLDVAGAAYCWGGDMNSVLGNGDAAGSSTTPGPVVMPPGVTFTQIAAASSATCALDQAGQAYCWGSGSRGQLGNGELGEQEEPATVTMPAGVAFESLSTGKESHHFCAISTDGDTYCWGDGSRGGLGNGSEVDQPFPTAVVWE